jgi:shikimate kinase/3-dehydroquinate synthase
VRVELAQAGYDILIGDGLLRRAGAEMARRLEGRRAVVVSDRNVAPLHLPTLREGLEEAGFTVAAEIAVPPGEGSKSLAEFGRVVEGILDARPDRRMVVVALGGGVVGDLAGYAAASVLRGLPFVQCPTSLLAQVDSSVGGKTGINTRHGKNLLGAFHQPKLVLADTATLRSLSPRELRAGWGEVAKHGLLEGPLWDWCEAHGTRAMAGDPAALAHAVSESCR